MIVFGSSFSPYVRKTLAYVAEKGIEVENRPSNPFDPDPEFIAVSPFRRIPAFRDGDFSISDSTAIITYLEAKHPLPALLDYLERVIPDDGYLVGGRLTVADLAVASPFVNMAHIGITPDPTSHP